jgi:hypothetical protein
MTRERVEPGIWRRGEIFEITWRDAQGNQRRRTVQGGITAARKALTDAKSKRDRGERTSDPRLTFTAAADAWRAARVVKLRPTTQNASAPRCGTLGPPSAPGASPTSAPLRLLATSRSAMRRADRQGRDDGPVGRLHLRRPPSWPPGQNPVTLLDHAERPSSADEKSKRILAGDELRRLLAAIDPEPPHLRDGRRDGRTGGRDVGHRLARGRSRRGDDHLQPPA